MATARDELRVLLLTPTSRDGELAQQFLARSGITAVVCSGQEALRHEIRAGAGAAMLGEEALSSRTVEELQTALAAEGPWSDLPILVFGRTSSSSDDLLRLLEPLGNVTILERPVRLSTLISAVRTALQARRRQYEVRDFLRTKVEADRRKDEFLAMLGHELRNPLAAIRNALFVLDEVGSSEPHDVTQRGVIERQVRHLVRMVDDLLDVSRVTLGKIALERTQVDLEELTRRCLDDLGLAAQAREAGLHLSLTVEPATVDGDPVRLEQVVCNLIQNAIKYTPAGGRVEVEARLDGGEAVLRVSDSGVGIPAVMLGSIFDLFTQVQGAKHRSQGGLGLGLPLVKSLVAMHGGTIEAFSDGADRGSAFEVRLPAVERAATPRLPVATQRHGGRLHVLVVEDNLDGRESLRVLLELWGHQVDTAESGPQGLAKALTGHPDIMLVDIGLPGFDGNELARRVRARLVDRPVTLVAMTGFGQAEDRQRAEEAGFDHYLVKPVDLADLTRLLDRYPNADPDRTPARPRANGAADAPTPVSSPAPPGRGSSPGDSKPLRS